MKYLNSITGLYEETTNQLVIDQVMKHKDLYKPVVGDLDETQATTSAPKKKATKARKKATKEVV